MQFNRRLVLMFAIMIAAFVAFALTAGAADSDPVTVSGILKAAGCPLTADQQKAFDDLSEEEGFRAVRTVTQTFTDEQNEALAAKLGEMAMPEMPEGMGNFGGGQAAGAAGGQGGGRMMGPRINYLSQVVILEKEGVPLTEKQLADAEAAAEAAAAEADQGGGMGFGRMGGMMALNDILTEEQNEAMQKYYGNMGGGMGGFGGGGMGGGMR